jgi:uncharacterized membrane protein
MELWLKNSNRRNCFESYHKNRITKNRNYFPCWFFVYPMLEQIFGMITNWNGGKLFKANFSMGILGGIVVVILGYINEIKPLRKLPFWIHCIIGALIVTGLEWITGQIVNIHLCWHVWDYKHLILSTPDGQINLFFSLIWLALSPVCFWLDDNLRMSYTIIINSKTKTQLIVVDDIKNSMRYTLKRR